MKNSDRTVLVCTVGTSLLGNLSRAGDASLRSLLERKNSRAIALALSERAPHEQLSGAEINSNHHILKKGLIARRHHLFLLVSDTEEGAFIGEILSAYYRRRQNDAGFENVAVMKIDGLTDRSPFLFRTEGLKNLVRRIAEVVERHGSESVLINATGGYKAQISFAGMIGQALEIPVCYLFEKFSEVIQLPPQPISMDMGFWLHNVPLFFELEEGGSDADPAAGEPRFHSLVELVAEDGGEKLFGLSAVGQLFHDMFKYRFRKLGAPMLPPDCGLAPEKKKMKFEDKNQGKHRGLEKHLTRLLQRHYVKRVYTHHYHPALPSRNTFRPSRKEAVGQIEGVFSDGKATTRFDLVTTAQSPEQCAAALADLCSTFQKTRD